MLVMRRFKLHTIIAVGALLAIHVAAFSVMLVLLIGVQDSIIDLNSSGGFNIVISRVQTLLFKTWQACQTNSVNPHYYVAHLVHVNRDCSGADGELKGLAGALCCTSGIGGKVLNP